MKKYSFIYVIILLLPISTLQAMEKKPLINPDVFTQQGKEYMDYSLDLWVESAQQGKITTGLAAIFSFLKKSGIDSLINDPVALEKANEGLGDMLLDPVFQALPALQAIGDYRYDGAKQLRADVARVITQAVASNVLIGACPNFKFPKTNLIGLFAAIGPDSIPYNIELLELNEQLDFAHNTPYVEALMLIIGYLAQTGMGR